MRKCLLTLKHNVGKSLTCVILDFLSACWVDRLDWLAEDQCWPLTLNGYSALGWARGRPGNSSQTETHPPPRAQEAAAPPRLGSRAGLQRVLTRTRFKTSRPSNLEFKVIQLDEKYYYKYSVKNRCCTLWTRTEKKWVRLRFKVKERILFWFMHVFAIGVKKNFHNWNSLCHKNRASCLHLLTSLCVYHPRLASMILLLLNLIYFAYNSLDRQQQNI